MTRSLSNFVNNLSEGIHKIKYKIGHNDKNVKRVELNINIVTAFLNIQQKHLNSIQSSLKF